MNARATFVALSFVLLTGCRVELPAVASATQCTYQAGLPGPSTNLQPQQLQALRSWFDAHSSGWHPTYITYVPTTLISGRDATGYPVSINIAQSIVVVNVPQGQFARSLSSQEASALFAILKNGNG
jgi:hypothetical protein